MNSKNLSKIYIVENKIVSLSSVDWVMEKGGFKKVPPWNSWVRRDRSKGVAHPAPNLLRDMWTNTNPEHRGR
ncbi:MAG: hypothetical protein ABSF45_27875, partial [Terriglobia bacterium]